MNGVNYRGKSATWVGFRVRVRVRVGPIQVVVCATN
jgi:hypothetical protein